VAYLGLGSFFLHSDDLKYLYAGIVAQKDRPGKRRRKPGGGCLVQVRFQSGQETILGHKIGETLRDLLALEEDQGGNAHDAIVHGPLLVGIHVQLENDQVVGTFLRDFLQHRGDHFAGTAPFGPKVHEDRLVELEHLGFKSVVGNCLGFTHPFNLLYDVSYQAFYLVDETYARFLTC
jgi:hypothetical protein